MTMTVPSNDLIRFFSVSGQERDLPGSDGRPSDHGQVPAENQVLQVLPHLPAEGDVEEGVDQTVEVAAYHRVIQQSPGVLVLLLWEKPAPDKDGSVGPPTHEEG